MSRRRNTGGSRASLSSALLTVAMGDLNAGVSTPSARVDQMLAASGLSPGSSWNAAAVSIWLAEAAASAGWSRAPASGGDAQTIIDQLIAAGRWRSKAALALGDVKPGMIVGAMFNTSVTVGVVSHINASTGVIYTIEGQAGEGQTHVALRTRHLTLPTFLGVGVL